MTKWVQQSALGAVLAKLTELSGRIERIRLERQRQGVARVASLLTKGQKK